MENEQPAEIAPAVGDAARCFRRPNRGRLLFADDDPHVLSGTSTVLRAAGFDVRAVASGLEAQEYLSKEDFDAMLLDIHMPGNRDLQLLRAATAERPFVPGVILTGHPCLATAIDSMRLGVVDYLVKPAKLNELVERLDSAIHRGKILRSVQQAEKMSVDLAQLMVNLKQSIAEAPGGHAPSEGLNPLRNLEKSELESLSPREHEVLTQLAQGNRVNELANLLNLSRNTIRNHLKSIFSKLGVNSQVGLLGKLASPRPRGSKIGAVQLS